MGNRAASEAMLQRRAKGEVDCNRGGVEVEQSAPAAGEA